MLFALVCSVIPQTENDLRSKGWSETDWYLFFCFFVPLATIWSHFEIHGWNLQLQCFGSCSHPPPRPQLRCVFDACDTTGSGLISLRQLANVSRSHVNGATQVLANSKFHFAAKAEEPQLKCLHRWSRSWTYLTLVKTGLRTTNSTSVEQASAWNWPQLLVVCQY